MNDTASFGYRDVDASGFGVRVCASRLRRGRETYGGDGALGEVVTTSLRLIASGRLHRARSPANSSEGRSRDEVRFGSSGVAP